MAKRRNLLFTSAGDKTQFYKLWCDINRDYDIFVCYYGNEKNKPYKKYCDYYTERKGGKFQNLDYFWNPEKYKEEYEKNNIIVESNKYDEFNNNITLDIHNYDKYFIIDDDILIFTKEINQLFNYLEIYQLDVLQPSLKPVISKMSHRCTLSVPNMILHYTNFIEVNLPLFSKEALTKCMSIYDNSLTGYGIDFLFMSKLGYHHRNKYAVIDTISCINPYQGKGNTREIEKLQSNQLRVYNWNIVKNKLNIRIEIPNTYFFIRK